MVKFLQTSLKIKDKKLEFSTLFKKYFRRKNYLKNKRKNTNVCVSLLLFLGTNVCAKDNGGCQQLCLYRGNSWRTCACAHGYLAEDGVTCLRHEGYLLYSGRTILKSIHLSDETNLNSPIRPYENPRYFKNVIALAFDYNQRRKGTNRIFYSDAHFGNIQLIKDNWEDRQVIVESKYKNLYLNSFVEKSIIWISREIRMGIACNNYIFLECIFKNGCNYIIQSPKSKRSSCL